MRTALISTAVWMAVFLTGCDSLSYRQFVIKSVTGTDKASVVSVMGTAARESGLEDRTKESRVQDTIAYFAELVPHFPVSLGARVDGHDIVIDLTCFHPGGPSAAPKAFRIAAASLSRDLPKAFPDRLVIDPKPRVPFRKEGGANQSREPTATTVMPAAGQPARQP